MLAFFFVIVGAGRIARTLDEILTVLGLFWIRRHIKYAWNTDIDVIHFFQILALYHW